MTDPGWVKSESGREGQAWRFGGAWTLSHANALDEATAALRPGSGVLTCDLSGLEMLDTAGAWLIMRSAERAGAAGAKVQWIEPPEIFDAAFLEKLSRSNEIRILRNRFLNHQARFAPVALLFGNPSQVIVGDGLVSRPRPLARRGPKLHQRHRAERT